MLGQRPACGTAANAACPEGRHVRRGGVPAGGRDQRRRDVNDLDLFARYMAERAEVGGR